MEKNKSSRRIAILRDSVSRKIAAGEVIERPASVVRELLDNSIDSEAGQIDLYLENGGLKRIRVVDDGSGMDREDLRICFLPHATSKIREAEDLEGVTSLGFRGEALAGVAACSRLSITSVPEIGTDPEPGLHAPAASPGETTPAAHTVLVDNGKLLSLSPSKGSRGTVVDVADLFYCVPARKKFMKSAAAEGTACKKTFLEKALPHPGITFRLFIDNDMKLFLPAGEQTDRILSAYPGQLEKSFLRIIEEKAGTFSFTGVCGTPSLYRKDRRMIQIYVNRRRIEEFSLIQAAEYGYSGYLPGGSHPVVFLFLNIDPEQVDFNVHPAKREARFRNLPAVHHQVVISIKNLLAEFRTLPLAGEYGHPEITRDLSFPRQPRGYQTPHHPPLSDDWLKRALRMRENSGSPETVDFPDYSPAKHHTAGHGYSSVYHPAVTRDSVAASGYSEYLIEHEIDPARMEYIGQIFNLFILVTLNGSLYLIDQHAAHERILFNEFRQRSRKTQNLLVPARFSMEAEEEDMLVKLLPEYLKLGITLAQNAPGEWELTSLPESCVSMQDLIISFVTRQRGSPADLETDLYSDLACKAAVKDGERLDPATGRELAYRALKLEIQRCPHGRPLWLSLDKSDLFKAVGRT